MNDSVECSNIVGESGTADCGVRSVLSMTGDNSISYTVSANDAASQGALTSKNSVAIGTKIGATDCSALREAENAIVVEMARLAKRYAVSTPPNEEFNAIKAALVAQSSNWKMPASVRHEHLTQPRSIPAGQDVWVALQGHVGGRVRVRGRAKPYIPIVLTAASLMCFVGPVCLDEADAPLLTSTIRHMVEPDKTVLPTIVNGQSRTGGTARVAYRLGCETRWNVMPLEQRCVGESLWEEPRELFGGYRITDPSAAISNSVDQNITPWARIPILQDGAAIQIPGSAVGEMNREVTAEASSPNLTSSSANREWPSLGAAPSEHLTVKQEHKTSTKLSVEHLPPRADLTPLPRARPKTVDD